MQANGQLSQAGERRIQNALFAYAYGDTALVERLAESTDNNAKNITNAMVATAGKVAQLQTEIERGEVQDLGLQHAITDPSTSIWMPRPGNRLLRMPPVSSPWARMARRHSTTV